MSLLESGKCDPGCNLQDGLVQYRGSQFMMCNFFIALHIYLVFLMVHLVFWYDVVGTKEEISL